MLPCNLDTLLSRGYPRPAVGEVLAVCFMTRPPAEMKAGGSSSNDAIRTRPGVELELGAGSWVAAADGRWGHLDEDAARKGGKGALQAAERPIPNACVPPAPMPDGWMHGRPHASRRFAATMLSH